MTELILDEILISSEGLEAVLSGEREKLLGPREDAENVFPCKRSGRPAVPSSASRRLVKKMVAAFSNRMARNR